MSIFFLLFFFLGLTSSGVKTTLPVSELTVDLLCLGSGLPAEDGSGSERLILASTWRYQSSMYIVIRRHILLVESTSTLTLFSRKYH